MIGALGRDTTTQLPCASLSVWKQFKNIKSHGTTSVHEWQFFRQFLFSLQFIILHLDNIVTKPF